MLASAGGAGAAIPQSALYDIQLEGNVNGIPFARTGVLAVGPTVTSATSNDVNAIELCMASGSPFISPEIGAIWFATNAICLNPRGALQDMAYVSVDAQANTVTIRPDPAISATGINGFNQNSGLFANVYQIFDGAMVVRFDGNGETIGGAVDILGTGAIFHSEQRYVATLAGSARELTPGASGGAGADGGTGSAGAGGGAGSTTPSDTTGPVVVLGASNKTISARSTGSFGFAVGPLAEDTTGTVAIKSTPIPAGAAHVSTTAKKVVLKLGTERFQANAGQKQVVKFKLSTRQRKLLLMRKRIRMVARVTARDVSGNATTRKFKFTLKAPKKKR